MKVTFVVSCSLSVVLEFHGIHEFDSRRKTMKYKEGYTNG